MCWIIRVALAKEYFKLQYLQIAVQDGEALEEIDLLMSQNVAKYQLSCVLSRISGEETRTKKCSDIIQLLHPYNADPQTYKEGQSFIVKLST